MSGLLAFRISYDDARREWALWTPDWPTTYHHSRRAALAHYYAAYRAHLADDAPGTAAVTERSDGDGSVPRSHAVSHVLRVSSQIEMGGIAAASVGAVASGVAALAGMEHPETIRDGSVGQSPGNAVRALGPMLNRELPITVGMETASPQPTIISLAPHDTRPEPVAERGHLGASSASVGTEPATVPSDLAWFGDNGGPTPLTREDHPTNCSASSLADGPVLEEQAPKDPGKPVVGTRG